jgi:hypothetical protein
VANEVDEQLPRRSDGAKQSTAMADKEKKTASEARSELQSSLQNFANYLNELQIVLEDQPDQLHTRMYGLKNRYVL